MHFPTAGPEVRLLLVPALGALLAAGLTVQAGAASAAVAPSAGHMAPASVGAGLGRLAPMDTVSEAQVCAKAAAKAGMSYNNYIHTNNGGSYPVMVVAVAIGLAESSCNPSASYTNPGTNCVDRGLWQIDSCSHSNVSNACAFQAQCNADAAFTISGKGYDWCPWSTYAASPSACGTPEDYVNYLGLAESAIYGFEFQLENQGDGTCLDADSTSKGNGGKIFQWSCNASDAYQEWYVQGSLGHLPVLKNAGTGTRLDLDGAKISNGGPIFQWSCNTSDHFQQWWWYGSGALNTNGHADAGMHVDGTSQTCLDGDGTAHGNGSPVFQWACNQNDTYQQWN